MAMDPFRDTDLAPDAAAFGLNLVELERRAHGDSSLPLREWVALAEAWRIAQALSEARGNRSAAARALRIGRRTLYSKIEKLGLVSSWRVAAGASHQPLRPGAHLPQPTSDEA